WPALNRLFAHLFTKRECTDLDNLSKVSTHFHHGVKEFMKREDNRPGIRAVHFVKTIDGMVVIIDLFASNIAFYDLANLDMGRLKRSMMSRIVPSMLVTLAGPEDSIIEQLADFLYIHQFFSTSIHP
ncbi:hypothetical protein PMAYCL1PPCAC_03520, partial [Pristionchus mayeri]